jgi:hypothetical protein
MISALRLRWFVAAITLGGAGWLVPCRAVTLATGVTSSSSTLLNNATVVWPSDAPWDTQANQPVADFVGDAVHPAFFASVVGETFFFRFRLNEPVSTQHAPGDFNQVVAVGIDLNGNNQADLAFGVSGKNGPGIDAGQSYFARFGESRGDPTDVQHFGSPYGARDWSTSGQTADFNYSLVSTIDGAVGDVPGSAGPNTFLTFSVSFGRLQDAVRALGGQYENFVVDTANALTFQFSGHSSTQTSSVNIDELACGQIIPELPTLAFLGVALVPLLAWRTGRRLWLR